MLFASKNKSLRKQGKREKAPQLDLWICEGESLNQIYALIPPHLFRYGNIIIMYAPFVELLAILFNS